MFLLWTLSLQRGEFLEEAWMLMKTSFWAFLISRQLKDSYLFEEEMMTISMTE